MQRDRPLVADCSKRSGSTSQNDAEISKLVIMGFFCLLFAIFSSKILKYFVSLTHLFPQWEEENLPNTHLGGYFETFGLYTIFPEASVAPYRLIYCWEALFVPLEVLTSKCGHFFCKLQPEKKGFQPKHESPLAGRHLRSREWARFLDLTLIVKWFKILKQAVNVVLCLDCCLVSCDSYSTRHPQICRFNTKKMLKIANAKKK